MLRLTKTFHGAVTVQALL